MTLQVTLRRIPLGTTPAGTRVEVPFDGTATSPHWEGERAVTGVDHITIGTNGIARLDVHAVVSGDGEVVAYRGTGRGGGGSIAEGVVFETACDRLAWLNETVAIGTGRVDGDELTVDLYRLLP